MAVRVTMASDSADLCGFDEAKWPGSDGELDGDADRDRARAVGDRGAMEPVSPSVVGLDRAEPAVVVELGDATVCVH
jgi:hypothetical protein